MLCGQLRAEAQPERVRHCVAELLSYDGEGHNKATADAQCLKLRGVAVKRPRMHAESLGEPNEWDEVVGLHFGEALQAVGRTDEDLTLDDPSLVDNSSWRPCGQYPRSDHQMYVRDQLPEVDSAQYSKELENHARDHVVRARRNTREDGRG